jgi:hypothetical protein
MTGESKRDRRNSGAAERPLIIEVDLDSIEALLERTRVMLSAEEQTLLEALYRALVEVTAIARARGSKMARIRKLFGLHKSEKTEDVRNRLGHDEPRREEAPPSTSDHSESPSASNDVPSEPPVQSESRDAEEEEEEKEKRKGHGRLSADDYWGAKVISIPHGSLKPGDPCPHCDGRMHEMKDPARVILLEARGPIEATRADSEKLRCGSCGGVFTAELPEAMKGPKYGPSVVAMIAALHYGYGMPFYRLGALQKNLGVPLPASTQWEIVRDAVPEFWPVFEYLRQRAARDPVMVSDDSTMPILEFMGKRRALLEGAGALDRPDRTGMYTTAIVTEDEEGRKVALFCCGRQHNGENMDDLLKLRPGELPPPTHVSDALEHNKPKSHDTDWGKCNGHARRGVVDEAENYPDEVMHILELYKIVFKNDRRARRKRMSPEERLEYHRAHSAPVMDKLRAWVDSAIENKVAEPNSDFGKALAYFQNHWDELTLFLRKPGVPITTNAAERALKKMILYRKNSYFFRNMRGAMVGALYASLIYTADLNGVNAFDYLVQLQTYASQVAIAPEDWMPWNYQSTIERLEESMAA